MNNETQLPETAAAVAVRFVVSAQAKELVASALKAKANISFPQNDILRQMALYRLMKKTEALA